MIFPTLFFQKSFIIFKKVLLKAQIKKIIKQAASPAAPPIVTIPIVIGSKKTSIPKKASSASSVNSAVLILWDFSRKGEFFMITLRPVR